MSRILFMAQFYKNKAFIPAILGFFCIAATFTVAFDSGVHREIARTNEKEVITKLESIFGNVVVSRGDPDKILAADIRFNGDEHAKTNIDYTVRNSVGYLDINLNKDDRHGDGEEHNVQIGEFENGKWYLRFTDAVPLRFDTELGCGKGEFDLTGLQVKRFKLSTGASSVILRCDEPNRSIIEDLHIESGVGKLVATNLCNTNFRRLEFSGGVGSYDLDFGGNFRSEADVKVEVGLGAITINIPENIGVKVVCDESWISKIHLDAAYVEKEENTYYTDNYTSARGRLNLKVEAGLGSVRIRRH